MEKLIVNWNLIELGISLTSEDMEIITKVVENDEDVRLQAEKWNMSCDEVREMYVNRRVELELEMKWAANIVNKISKGEFTTDNEVLNTKYKEYSESDDISLRQQLLSEMIKIYIADLVNKAMIEYIN